jgi:predicted amidohydrolase YtcJ
MTSAKDSAMRRFSFLLLFLFAVMGCQPGDNNLQTTLILHGGHIITQDTPTDGPTPTAIAMAGNRIIKVGDDATVLALKGKNARLVDLAGAVVVPGFNDSHCHLYGLGKALSEIDLNGTRSPAEVAMKVAIAHTEQPGKGWLLGRGWDQNDWEVKEYPNKELLDEVVGHRPVLLRRVDGHAALASSRALELASITAQTPDPDGGQILRDKNGEPTGVLIDNGVDLVGSILPTANFEEVARRVNLAIEHCHQYGITGVHEAGVSWSRAQFYKMLADQGELDLRIYGLLDDIPQTLTSGFANGPIRTPDDILTVRAVKLYADGALGSRGARLLRDYCDHSGHRGLFVTDIDHIRDITLRGTRAGFQIGTHAIGDEANRVILDVFEEINQELKPTDPRWRIEHSQILSPEDIPRLAELGVIAAMQPVHCTSDMDWAADRLCEDRLAGAYAWKSLLDTGAHLCFGTDFPVEHVDPLAGLYSARTRTHPDGRPEGGWQPQEIIDGETALNLYTAGSAYAGFMEDRLGIIKNGYYADLTILDGNPVTCDPADLLKMKVKMTIVAGKIVYQAD